MSYYILYSGSYFWPEVKYLLTDILIVNLISQPCLEKQIAEKKQVFLKLNPELSNDCLFYQNKSHKTL